MRDQFDIQTEIKQAVNAALEPIVAWAKETHPVELEAIHPQGKRVFNEETGRRWVALLKKWHDAKLSQ